MLINQYPEKLLPENTDNFLTQDTSGITRRISRENLLSGISSGGNSGLSRWALANSARTAVAGERLIIDTTNNFTLTLPANPTQFDEIELIGYKLPNALTIASSKKFNSVANSQIKLRTIKKLAKLIYLDESIGWLDINNIVEAAGLYTTEVLADLPYAYFLLDELTGTTLADKSVNGREGTITGTPNLAQDGLINDGGKAIKFNGNSLIYLLTSTTAPTAYTLECRFKTSVAGGSLFGFGNAQQTGSGSYDRELYINSSGKLCFYIYPGFALTIATTVSVNDNLPHTATVISQSGLTQIWLDGVLASSANTGGGASYTGFWRIGHSTTGGYFNGIIDSPNITHGAISEARIQARHAAAVA